MFKPVIDLYYRVVTFFVAFGLWVEAALKWVWAFFLWLFYDGWNKKLIKMNYRDEEIPEVGLLVYLIRYILVIAFKIIDLPKCLLWYLLDFIGWALYMPIRVLLWTIDYMFDLGIVKGEHVIWRLLGMLDYYIHGPQDNYFNYQYKNKNRDRPRPDPNSLNTGVHIIHFPNSVMRKCFSIQAFKLKAIPSTKRVDEMGTKLKRAITGKKN